MPTPYFHFKQFTVWHNQCAMKVGTDGVLLGAWTPVDDKTARILDIGTGSGLVALMLAQRCKNAEITAIDIDEGAFRQSSLNFRQSPWNNRIVTLHRSLQEFSNSTTDTFDLIVSNPPFFSNSLKAPDEARKTARHNDSLPLEELLKYAAQLVNETGSINLILPVTEKEKCVKCAEKNGLFCIASNLVFPKPTTAAKRIMLRFGKVFSPEKLGELVIESQTRGKFMPGFEALVRDFYLNL
jgi:tRNA1Val (adenine37-N6)-methyltransferase